VTALAAQLGSRVSIADLERETRPLARELCGTFQNHTRERLREVAARFGRSPAEERERFPSQGHAKVTTRSAFARKSLILLSGSTGTRTLDLRVKSPPSPLRSAPLPTL
jgi:hypothetical protein